MKPTNVLTSGRIELPGEEQIGDYFVKPGILEEAYEQRCEEITRAWYAGGERFEF